MRTESDTATGQVEDMLMLKLMKLSAGIDHLQRFKLLDAALDKRCGTILVCITMLQTRLQQLLKEISGNTKETLVMNSVK